ncbi:TRAP transporter small permease subunit [Limibacillus sp. MBR-115]|uniref:TRAP transporter small permease subunit n=1 Tax=Limibacillus sp. MBR-115 TaxID=3156465 RepID=UPI0033948C27
MEKEQLHGMSRFAHAMQNCIDLVGRINAWVILLMVLLVFGNVALRYLFSMGWVALHQLEWHLMPPLVLIGMSYALRHDEHVRVDIFYARYSPTTRQVVNVFSGLIAVIISVGIIHFTLPWWWQSFSSFEGSYEAGGLPYLFVLKAFIPIGFALMTIQASASIILSMVSLINKAP